MKSALLALSLMAFSTHAETVDVSQTTFSETVVYKVNKSDLSIQVLDASNETPVTQVKLKKKWSATCIDAKPGEDRVPMVDYCDTPMTKAEKAELAMYERCNYKGIRYYCNPGPTRIPRLSIPLPLGRGHEGYYGGYHWRFPYGSRHRISHQGSDYIYSPYAVDETADAFYIYSKRESNDLEI